MRRKALFSLIVAAAALGALLLVVNEAVETKKAQALQDSRELNACLNLGLGMTRDEVTHALGSPAQEASSAAPGGERLTTLRFATALSQGRPYPYVVFERGLAIEVRCAEDVSLVATDEERAKMFQALSSQAILGQDAVRP